MSFNHLIISRVNIPRQLDPSKYDNPAPYKDVDWNNDRIRLLNKYLRSSLKQQTCKDFTFITLWNSEYIDTENALEGEKQIVIKRGWDDWDEQYFDFAKWKAGDMGKETMDFWNQIKHKTQPFSGERTLVTSIDSDDALHYKFVENIQQRATNYDPPFYLDAGMRYAVNDRNNKTGLKNSSNVSPCCSSLEAKYECWPLKYHHYFIGHHLEGRKFSELAFLQSISGNNIYCGSIGKPVMIDIGQYI